MNAVAQVLGLKIEWTEEVGWGLPSKDWQLVDMIFPVMVSGAACGHGRVLLHPICLSPLFIVTKTDLVGSDDDYRWLNDQGYKATVLKFVHDVWLQRSFLNHRRLTLWVVKWWECSLDVSSGKGGFLFLTLHLFRDFLVKIPDSWRSLINLCFCQGILFTSNDDYRLKHMVDSALEFLIESGRWIRLWSGIWAMIKTQWLSVRSENQRTNNLCLLITHLIESFHAPVAQLDRVVALRRQRSWVRISPGAPFTLWFNFSEYNMDDLDYEKHLDDYRIYVIIRKIGFPHRDSLDFIEKKAQKKSLLVCI